MDSKDNRLELISIYASMPSGVEHASKKDNDPVAAVLDLRLDAFGR